jgi:hypothetical protein
MRGNPHVRFGGRAEETDRPKRRHRASVRSNHTGQTLAAAAGATLKDLMKRLGHSSTAAATRYLHAVDGRDAEIAAALSELARAGTAAMLPRSITVGR